MPTKISTLFYQVLNFIVCSVLIQVLIALRQLQLFHNYTTKIWLGYVSELRNLLYRTIIRDFIIFHQMILSINDCLCKLGYIKCYLKLFSFDHSQQFRIHYFRASMQNILVFFSFFLRAKCSVLSSFIQNSRNNYQITKKN